MSSAICQTSGFCLHRLVNLLLLAGVLWLVWGLRPRVDSELVGKYSREPHGLSELILEPDGTWGGWWRWMGRSPWRDYQQAWSCEHGAVVVRRTEYLSSDYSLLPGGHLRFPEIFNKQIGRFSIQLGLNESTTQIWRFKPVRIADGVLGLVQFKDNAESPVRLHKCKDPEPDLSPTLKRSTAVELGIDFGGNPAVDRADRSDDPGFPRRLDKFFASEVD